LLKRKLKLKGRRKNKMGVITTINTKKNRMMNNIIRKTKPKKRNTQVENISKGRRIQWE